ncbi:cell division protein FtsQ/DivIB [Candidatus Pelagibacter sp. Uisw_092]|uniref:cell division protein FtsQ/DivIB n=1 Tax=Candidatus Pelagibacter sp. Uisw_092 TaxID=3230979 RepID=UPI0039E8E6C1
MPRLIGKKNNIIIYLLFLFIFSTTSAKLADNQKKLSSLINKIDVVGLSTDKNLEILNSLDNLFYKNIFILSKDEIKKVLDKQNIVEEFTIKKIYPSTLYIKIKPTKFIARISNKDQSLIGTNGKIIKNNVSNEKLPYVFGEFNPNDFLNFKNNIQQSEFSFSELKTLYFFPSKRWDILTKNDILIKLPQGHIIESLNLAYKIINTNNFKDKKFIDLRVKNHLVTK